MATAFRPCGDYYATSEPTWRCEWCDQTADICTCDIEDAKPAGSAFLAMSLDEREAHLKAIYSRFNAAFGLADPA